MHPGKATRHDVLVLYSISLHLVDFNFKMCVRAAVSGITLA